MYESSPMIDLTQRAKALSGVYENVALTSLNDHVLRMSRMEKAYPWHCHPNSDRPPYRSHATGRVRRSLLPLVFYFGERPALFVRFSCNGASF